MKLTMKLSPVLLIVLATPLALARLDEPVSTDDSISLFRALYRIACSFFEMVDTIARSLYPYCIMALFLLFHVSYFPGIHAMFDMKSNRRLC
jgi:hypothetical protein